MSGRGFLPCTLSVGEGWEGSCLQAGVDARARLVGRVASAVMDLVELFLDLLTSILLLL